MLTKAASTQVLSPVQSTLNGCPGIRLAKNELSRTLPPLENDLARLQTALELSPSGEEARFDGEGHCFMIL